jgi:hypothetical protein
MISPCACIGPVGDCPCIREAKGLSPIITESQISSEVFDCLSEEDKRTINDLKVKAFFIWQGRK